MPSDHRGCSAEAREADRKSERRMRIDDYVVRPDTHCWVVAAIKKFRAGSRKGEEYETDLLVYPGRFDQALRTLLRPFGEGWDRARYLPGAGWSRPWHYLYGERAQEAEQESLETLLDRWVAA